MKELSNRLTAVLQSVPQRLGEIPDAEASREPGPGRWSKKQVLGHLIDSASNNHQRIVRALIEPGIDFPAYQQEAWVSVQDYSTEAWADIVHLWLLLNRHLLHIIRTISESGLSLAILIAGYLDHLDHHLDQMLGSG